jgi:prepilin signal peptidase PulO-like enzyme (type II secretory pathway)
VLALAYLQAGIGSALVGAVLGASAFVLPMVLYGKASAGGGDVKLAMFIGAALGFPAVVSALFFAGLSASVAVAVGLATRRISRRQKIPFGPFLALGGVAAMLLLT